MLGDLAKVLREKNWRPSWASLVPIRPGGSKAPLFLMHSHGGNVLEYYPLANLLDQDLPVYALQARGLDGHILKDRSLEEMTAGYLEEIRSLQPEGPYFLAGFCFGGLLALEAAQQLTADGEEVAIVFMIQSMHPASFRFKPGTALLNQWWYRTTKRLGLERENLNSRGTAYIQERGRRAWDIARARTSIALDSLTGNGHVPETGVSMPYVLESLAIEHEKAYDKYEPHPYSGDVVLFRATKQLAGLVADTDLGWKDVVRGKLDICEVPGHQQNILLEPNVSLLAAAMTSRLRLVWERSGLRT